MMPFADRLLMSVSATWGHLHMAAQASRANRLRVKSMQRIRAGLHGGSAGAIIGRWTLNAKLTWNCAPW